MMCGVMASCTGMAPRAEVHRVDSLNQAAYSFRYKNLDSLYEAAEQASQSVRFYRSGKAEACNNLAFHAFMQMDYEKAEELYLSVRDQTQNEIKKHLAIGCKNIGLGMMPRECLFDMDKLNKFIGDVRVIIDKLEEKGCKFFYHNHHIEFYKLPIGVTVFDYLLAKLPDLNITLDTHWVQRGGADVVDTIKKCAGRLECVHLKDYIINDKLEPTFAAVGEGNMNWSKILPAFEAAGTRYAFVEQDDAPDLGEPFDYLKISRVNLKSMRY